MQRLFTIFFTLIFFQSYSQENRVFDIKSYYLLNLENERSSAIFLEKDSTLVHINLASNNEYSVILSSFSINRNENKNIKFESEYQSGKLFALNDSLFVSINKNKIRLWNSDLNLKWVKQFSKQVGLGSRLTDSTFFVSDYFGNNFYYDEKNYFILNHKGEIITTKIGGSLNNIGISNERVFSFKTFNANGVPKFRINVYNHLLESVIAYEGNTELNFLGDCNIYSLNNRNKYVISISNEYDQMFYLLNLNNNSLTLTKIKGYLHDKILGVYQLNDSTLLGYGSTQSLGKGNSGYLSPGYEDLFVFTCDTNIQKLNFISLGLINDYYNDFNLSPFIIPHQGKLVASFFKYTNSYFNPSKFQVNYYNLDSLYSCDAIYSGDSIFKINRNVIPFTTSIPDSLSILLDSIKNLSLDSISIITSFEDSVCNIDCDFNVFVTANANDSYNKNKTYIEVEVAGRKPPYNIIWHDGDTNWIRSDKFTSYCNFKVSDSAGCKRSFEYYFDRTIGVKEVTEKIEFTVYPNPTHGILNFSTSTIQKVNSLQIFDLFGRMVYKLKNVELFEGYSIDLSHLQNGVYFVVSQTENNQFTNRIIISQ